jgi:hypothetical protein
MDYLSVKWPLFGVESNAVERINAKNKRRGEDCSSSKHLCVVKRAKDLI